MKSVLVTAALVWASAAVLLPQSAQTPARAQSGSPAAAQPVARAAAQSLSPAAERAKHRAWLNQVLRELP